MDRHNRLLLSLGAILVVLFCSAGSTWVASPGQAGVHGGGAPVSPFIIEEGFEGTGTPTNFTQSSPGTAANFDYSAAPLTGSQSLYITDPGGSGNANAQVDFTASAADTMYAAFKWKPTASIASSSDIAWFQNAAANVKLGALHWRASDQVLAVTHTGPLSGTITAAITAGNTYWIKMRYIKASGAGNNAQIALWISTDGLSWSASPIQLTNGPQTDQAVVFKWDIFHSRNFDMVLDSVRIDTDDIAIEDVP